MNTTKWTDLEMARLCRELAVLIHAGILLSDGLDLLAREETGALSVWLKQLSRAMDAGQSLSSALAQSGDFPSYLVGLLAVGERTGRMEQALQALGRYYDERDRQDRQIRSALTYPALLLLMMLGVILVLLTRVLPVFEDVYASLGGGLSGAAGGLLLLGQRLSRVMPLVCLLLIGGTALVLAFAVSEGFRTRVMAVWNARFGDRGIGRLRSSARFAQALAMGLASGLPLEEAVELAAPLMQDVPEAALRCKDCSRRLMDGDDLVQALRGSELLPAAACRLLEVGLRSGAGDGVMEDIARRLTDEADQALERRIAMVEPTLVLVTSLLVGVILLTVMLPLMDIMAAIG